MSVDNNVKHLKTLQDVADWAGAGANKSNTPHKPALDNDKVEATKSDPSKIIKVPETPASGI